MMKRLLLILFLCSTCFAQYHGVKPMLGEQVNWSDPINRGLAVWWLGNEGAGNRVNDISGNGNHGTITGATWAPGKFGPCLRFDGDSDYITTDVVPPSRFTIMVWASIDSSVDAQRIWSLGRSDLELLQVSGTWVIYNNVDVLLQGPAIVLGRQECVAVTVDGTTAIQLYVNGQLSGEDTSYSALTPLSLYFGARRDLLGNWLTGTIDAGVCYSRALTPSEIARLYREPFAGLGDDDDVTRWVTTAEPPGGGTPLWPPILRKHNLRVSIRPQRNMQALTVDLDREWLFREYVARNASLMPDWLLASNN